MPDFSILMLFAAAALVLTATPGPDMLLIASRSVSQGRSAGFLTYAGIAAGTYCHAIAAALGLSQLFLTVPIAYEIVRWAGCAYLLYLAYKTLRSRSSAFAPSAGLKKTVDQTDFQRGSGRQHPQPENGAIRAGAFSAIHRSEWQFDVHPDGTARQHSERHWFSGEWCSHSLGYQHPSPFVSSQPVSQATAISAGNRVCRIGMPSGTRHQKLKRCIRQCMGSA